MDNVIQLLKDNEKPFGLMSEEMQEKAKEIGRGEFDVYQAQGWGNRCGGELYPANTYRLRADYKDEPEIVGCKIYQAECTKFYVDVYDFESRTEIVLARTPVGYKRIGYKFGDVKQIINKEVGYSHNGVDILPFVQYDELKSGRFKVLHATHVLFRRQK